MDILQDLPENEVEALMNGIPVHTAEKGTEFYGPDGPEVLFLLMSGRVEMFRQSVDGKRLTLAIVEPGTVFGEMSLIGQRMVGTCATAIEDSVICAMSRTDVEALMTERPQVALRIIEVLAGRLQQTRDALEEMSRCAKLGPKGVMLSAKKKHSMATALRIARTPCSPRRRVRSGAKP